MKQENKDILNGIINEKIGQNQEQIPRVPGGWWIHWLLWNLQKKKNDCTNSQFFEINIQHNNENDHVYIEEKKYFKKEEKWRNQYKVGKNECNICYEKDFSNVNNALLYPAQNVLFE